jgi:predicted metal-dependent phosphoesterase TrpH
MTAADEPVPASRADLHVHSCHSTVNGDLPFFKSRDCYSRPIDVYRTAKARGMRIVTITDHDSIDGCLELLELCPDADDILVGEEVSCRFPDQGIQVHLAVYGMTEALHRDLQPLRENVFEVVDRLRDAEVFFALNHLLHFYRGQLPLESYLRLVSLVPALEVRNGTMTPPHNLLIEALRARCPGLAAVAGSDAHTLRRIGRTWTSAPGRTAAEFLASLRAGLGQPGGRHGGAAAVAGDAYGVVTRYAASIYGWGPRDHSGWHRLICAAAVPASLPFQFLPALLPLVGKFRERRAVAAASAPLGRWQLAVPSGMATEQAR